MRRLLQYAPKHSLLMCFQTKSLEFVLPIVTRKGDMVNGITPGVKCRALRFHANNFPVDSWCLHNFFASVWTPLDPLPSALQPVRLIEGVRKPNWIETTKVLDCYLFGAVHKFRRLPSTKTEVGTPYSVTAIEGLHP